MFYIAKLARRLARLRLGVTRIHFVGMMSLLLLTACAAGAPTSSTDSGSLPDEAKTLFISPKLMTLEGSQSVRFAAFESLLPGSDEATAIEWTATGGSVGLDGSYTPGELSTGSVGPDGYYIPGGLSEFKVVGKKKGWANKPPTDTAVVLIVAPQPTLVSLSISPSDKSAPSGSLVQFTATGWLSDSTSAAVGVTWTATGGTIDVGGLYKAGNTPGTFYVVAKHVTTGFADTAKVTVGAVLQSIQLNPSSTSLQTGTTKQFSVTGTMTDGSTAVLAGVTYSTNGGSITSGGLYTAPSAGGTYSVTAKVTNINGNTISNSATVSVTTPSSTGTSGISTTNFANLPSGYTRFAEHPLSWLPSGTNGNSGSWWQGGSRWAILSDNAAPFSASGVMELVIPAGLPGGAGPGGFGGWDGQRGEYSSIYVSFGFRIGGSDYENHFVRTKLAEIGYGEPYGVGGNAQGVIGISGEGGGRTLASSFKLDLAQQRTVARTLDANVNTQRLLTVGPWHRVEVVMTINSIGSANGTFKLWIDGQLTHSYSNVVYRTAEYPYKFYAWKHDIVWGGIGGERTRNDRFLWDHVYIAGVR
jgi:hypothetical protein